MKNKIKMILGVLVVGFICHAGVFASSQTISYQKLQEYKSSLSGKKIAQDKVDKIQKLKKKLGSKRCDYYKSGDDYIIDPVCFLKGDLPDINDPLQVLDVSLSYIKKFDKAYSLDKSSFVYRPASIEYFDDKPSSIDKKIDTQIEEMLYIVFSSLGYKIRVPQVHFAIDNLDDYSYYLADKNLSKRNGCRLKNYKIAMEGFENLTLKPGEEYNYNQYLVNQRSRYCKQASNKKYLFYGGVCGASTQAFRTSLINPYLKVTERHSHSQRYVNFYDKTIYGDDASVYEWQKQFQIKNIASKPLYFKVFRRGNKEYLLSIYPDKTDYRSMVIRKQLGRLKAVVGKMVFNKSGMNNKWYEQFWSSQYYKRNYES